MSVGHVARMMEEAGIATVVVGVAAFCDRMVAMQLPRMVITPHLMGRPLGAPHDVPRQREVVLAALDLLETATTGGSMREVIGTYRPATG